MKAKRKVGRAARHLFRLCLIDGGLDDDRARLMAQRITASRRRGVLPILSEFRRLVRLERGRFAAVVESAAPLGDRLRMQIRSDLERMYGPKVDASFEQNPALIGGMRIRVGSDVYDGSVRARLAALQARL